MSSEPLDLEKERALKHAFSQLKIEEAPPSDLWKNIEPKLVTRETNFNIRHWIPTAVACSLTLAVSLMVFKFTPDSTENIGNQGKYAENLRHERINKADDISDQIKQMEQEYGLAKSALLAQISGNNSEIDVEMLEDVKTNLLIIENATEQLKSAINKQPNNPNLPILLKSTYEQELVVLSQLAKLNQKI